MNGKGVVVVAEADDLIRGLLERWLSEAGYTPVIEIDERPAGATAVRPVLVIANIAIPKSAPALIRRLKETYGAPILLLSARFQRGLGASTEAARRMDVRKVLPKPFTRKELQGAVKEAIGEAH